MMDMIKAKCEKLSEDFEMNDIEKIQNYLINKRDSYIQKHRKLLLIPIICIIITYICYNYSDNNRISYEYRKLKEFKTCQTPVFIDRYGKEDCGHTKFVMETEMILDNELLSTKLFYLFILYSIISIFFNIYLFRNIIYIPTRPSRPIVKLPLRNYNLINEYEEKYNKPDLYLSSPRISYAEYKERDNDRYSRNCEDFYQSYENYEKEYRKYRADAYKFLLEIRNNY